MVKYACFTLATLVFLTLTDFTSAESVAQEDQISVAQVNRYYPGLISTTVDPNSPAKTVLNLRNLWSFWSPHLNLTQDATSLTPNQAYEQLWTIHSFLTECMVKLSSHTFTYHFFIASHVLEQQTWDQLSLYLHEIKVGHEIIHPDSLTVEQTLDQIYWMIDFVSDATDTVSKNMNAMSLLSNVTLWSRVN